MKVVINTCVGGFGLSQQALEMLNKTEPDWVEENDSSDKYFPYYEFLLIEEGTHVRCNEHVIAIVELLRDAANTKASALKIVEIPDGTDFYIGDNNMGIEWIGEVHRTWR